MAEPPGAKPAELATSEYAVPELGVKFTIPNSINDLTYQIKDVQLSNGETIKAAYFTTKALAKADAKCNDGVVSGSVAGMIRGEGQYPRDDDNVGIDYGPLLKQFPSAFITFLTSRAPCTNDSKDEKVQKLFSDTAQALSDSVKTIELTN